MFSRRIFFLLNLMCYKMWLNGFAGNTVIYMQIISAVVFGCVFQLPGRRGIYYGTMPGRVSIVTKTLLPSFFVLQAVTFWDNFKVWQCFQISAVV